MNKIRNIFTLKPKDPTPVVNEPIASETPSEDAKIRLTFYESGYGSSTHSEGNYQVFRACLEDVYMDFKAKCREDLELQNKLKAPVLEEKGKHEIELKKRKTVLGILEDQVKACIDKINTYKFDIIEVRRTPENYGIAVDKRPKAQFYIGLFVLIPITFYLLVFYMSASYSAFFKNFETDALASAIFDGKAIAKAYNDGWLEAIFVSTIPFAFMGLGYLIHMFQKKKHWSSYLKIVALFLVTFLFDSILAYQIESKIYEINKTLNSPPFDLPIALRSISFWGIIFAGFVVYIIWGLIFDFVMREYENLDKINGFIKTRQHDISNMEQQKTDIEQSIVPVKEEISELESKISLLQKTIDGFIFPDRKYLTYHAEYVKGWYMSISKNFASHSLREKLLDKCIEQEKEHLRVHEIDNEDFENKIYRLTN